ncbi:MAG: hypothetical protein Satyrvirus1_33 [Satyrvirus sp.]|uniref:glycylpeptide N-tetradecanoyltransferase n=1 Tax=Satyrvirus sp. TaxID=2487771 RepID=A0A3G5ACS1_9VIRU|nr:MAG: hypothetical protein Satyrvirus1_33 [Satyrvirus sp.]
MPKDLPDGFKIKTLTLAYLDEIYKLISNHYIEDDQHLVRLIYSKKFLYWYLKDIPPGFIIGLLYKNILVGMITALFINMAVHEKNLKLPYINFFCIQSKIRNLGLGKFLIDELKYRLDKIEITCALFTGTKLLQNKPFCVSKDFIIPINYPVLKEVGFLADDLLPLPAVEYNCLHLMTVSDIASVVPKLNKFLEKFKIKLHFNTDNARHFLLPKKNIIYTFVNRDTKGIVTDLITVYKNYYYCIEKQKIITVGHLAYYYYETMSFTQLIIFLLDKLRAYHFDQLVFRNISDNSNINITRFSTYSQLYYYLFNIPLEEIEPSEISVLPL